MFKILVNGKNYSGFEDVQVSVSFLDSNSSATIKMPVRNVGKQNPIKANDDVQLSLNNHKLISGYVDIIKPDMSPNGRLSTATIRDYTGDLVDSTIDPADWPNPITANITLKKLLEKFVSALYKDSKKTIKVVDNVTNENLTFFVPDNALQMILTKDDNVTIEAGESYFQVMMEYAHKFGCILRADGDGNVSIERGSNLKYKTKLGVGVIKNSTLNIDMTKRYYQYKLIAQQSPASFDFDTPVPASINDISAIATDTGSDWGGIRKSRVYVFKPETSTSTEDAQTRVNWEANYRRSNSLKYSCTVCTFEPQEDPKEIWKVNRLVEVHDIAYGLIMTMMINKVSYSYNCTGGTSVMLELVTSDAFNLNVEKPESVKKGEVSGGDFNFTPAEFSKIKKDLGL